MTEPAPKKTHAPEASAIDTHKQDECDATLDQPTEQLSSSNDELIVALPEKFGRYRILHRLGQGAMGTVYLAVDTHLDRRVALKVPQFGKLKNSPGLERFFREARVMASLRHPNLCPVYDAGEMDGTYYLTMAYIQGQPLVELMRPRWPQRQAAELFEKLGRAVHEAHRAGIIHRDLKPSNIMVEKGEPIIMDFGLATRQLTEDLALTRSGMIVGTPAYMSPEQVSGERNLGPATDIYSLGVILYQMLSGELPFQGSLVTVLGKIVMSEPPPLKSLREDIDDRLERICMKALAKNPEERFADGTKMSFALTAYLRGDPEPSSDVTATEVLPTKIKTIQKLAEVPVLGDSGKLTELEAERVRWRQRLVVRAALAIAALLVLFVGWRSWVASNRQPITTASPVSNAPVARAEPSVVAVEPSALEKGIAALEQARAQFAAARKRAEQANRTAAQLSADAPELAEQDQSVIEEYQAAIRAAEEQHAPESTELQAELVAFKRNRSESRAATQAAREQVQKHVASAQALVQESQTLAKSDKADDSQLEALDKKALDELRAANTLALQHRLEVAVIKEIQTDLLAIENSPQFKDRESRKKVRQEVEAKIALGKTALPKDPQQALTLFSDALELLPPDSPQRWMILRDRSAARAQLARASQTSDGLQLAFDDVEKAIASAAQSAARADSANTHAPNQQDVADLYYSKATLAEELDETQRSDSKMQQATAAFEEAWRLDPTKFDFSLGIARTILKQVQREPAVATSDARFSKIEQALADAAGLKSDSAEAHNLLGEFSMLRGDIPTARTAFKSAISASEPNVARRSRYSCNLSRSFLVSPADPKQALAAAEQAIALDGSTMGRFCRGQALRLLKQTPLDAIREFDQVLESQPQHVEALLARSQLVIETSGVSAAQVARAYKDISTALSFAPNTPLKAEAYYVQSLARLRDVVKLINAGTSQTPVEEALIKCQESAWEALKLDPQSAVYKKHAKEVFENAARFKWQDTKLQQASSRLRQQYDNLSVH